MKKIVALAAITVGLSVSAQQKTHIVEAARFLKNINPNIAYDGYLVILNDGTSQKVLKSAGYTDNYTPQDTGFKFLDSDNAKYYIAYSKSGLWNYVDNFSDLRSFLGTVDNVDEAGLAALADGYFFDTEFKDYSSNYKTDAANYYLEAAKVTSEKCPYAKSHYMLTVDKKTGIITKSEDLGVYSKIYEKDCENHPTNDALKQQMEEAKQKQEEERIRQKAATEKMRKKVLKRMRKD